MHLMHCTLRKTHLLKKFHIWNKETVQKIPSFLGPPTHQSFNFNLGYLYQLKHKVCLSKIVCGIFRF